MFLLKAYYGVLLIALTLILTVLLTLIVFKGTYDIHYLINQKGILCENQPSQAKRVKKLSAIALILSFFSSNATAAGAGMLSGGRTKVFIPWERIKKTKHHKKQKSIMIYGGFAENFAVFCTEENYNQVNLFITEKMMGDR